MYLYIFTYIYTVYIMIHPPFHGFRPGDFQLSHPTAAHLLCRCDQGHFGFAAPEGAAPFDYGATGE